MNIVVPSTNNIPSIKADSLPLIKNGTNQTKKKYTDTTIVLFFNDLSPIYNYKIIDKYYCTKDKDYYDNIFRIIKIYHKNDSLLQKIVLKLQMTPWYFHEHDYHLRLSRSYVTGKNANYNDMDNYCGEIVVADLNFDGLEDFATPENSGVDNGPHYAFFIQDTSNKFNYNTYLTENLTWFPEKMNSTQMSFTSSIPCTVYGTWFQTFKYDTIFKKWKKIEDYVIDNRTGKIMK